MKAPAPRLAERLTSALFPRAAICLLCGDPRRAQPQDCLCPDCREALERLRLRGSLCLRCMHPLDERGRCAFCASGGLQGLHEGFAAFRHQGAARELVMQLKYQYCNEAADALAQAMAQCVPLGHYDALTPVPLHPRRQRMRGGNQAELLCRALSPQLGMPALDLLSRVRETREQASLARGDRLRNVQGAFALRCDTRGLRVLLVDDVRTTGATARACAQALTLGGAREVSILTATLAVHMHEERR